MSDRLFLALGLLFQGMKQASISDIGYSAVSYLKYGLIDYPLTSIKNFSDDFANLWKVKDEMTRFAKSSA